MFGDHGLCGLLEEGAHGKSPKCLGGNLGDFGEFCKGLSVGFAHESNPKFQTASFTQHFRGQSPRYHLRLQGKRSSEKRFSVYVGRILESDIFKHFRHNQKQ